MEKDMETGPSLGSFLTCSGRLAPPSGGCGSEGPARGRMDTRSRRLTVSLGTAWWQRVPIWSSLPQPEGCP